MIDKFGITQFYPTTTREWFSNFNTGSTRTYGFGPAGSQDTELIFRGSGTYTIYGNTSDSNNGLMKVTGSAPRIYVRGSTLETKVPTTTKKWNNTETTFYCKTTNSGSNVSYAGIEAVICTDHYPDSDLHNTRGYGGKINFDGRAQFEKETCHGSGEKQVATVYPFTNKGRMPLNTWIGYKLIGRSCENGAKFKLELYMDLTNGLNGGDWKLLTTFTDYDGWSKDVSTCCETHRGRVLTGQYATTNYSVYLRTDGNATQYYKNFSVREISALN